MQNVTGKVNGKPGTQNVTGKVNDKPGMQNVLGNVNRKPEMQNATRKVAYSGKKIVNQECSMFWKENC